MLLLGILLTAAWTALRAPGSSAKASPGRPGSGELARVSGIVATSPDGVVFDLAALIVVSTVIGGFLSHLFDVTPLIGITWVAFAWANCTGTAAELTDGITAFVRLLISRVGLMVILVRAGLSLDLPSARADALRVAVFATIPLLAEASVHAAISRAIIGDGWAWCFLRGFLGAAIAPSVVVPGVLKAKAAEWGASDSPANAMLAAVTIESATAVWAIAFLIELALPSSGGRSTTLTAVLGPVQLLGGTVLGCLLGSAIVGGSAALSVERGARTQPGDGLHKRVVLTVAAMLGVVCLACVFLGSYLELAGGGSLAAVSTAAFASFLWARGQPSQRALLAGAKARFAGWWDAAVLPALFCMLGSSIDAKTVFAADFLGDYAPGLLAGVATRFVVSFGCAMFVPRFGAVASNEPAATLPAEGVGELMRPSWTVAEAAWFAVSWIGKASVQAALGGAALVVALEHADGASAAAATTTGNTTAVVEAAENVQRARGVASLASLAAVAFAPLSAGLMRALGPPLLGAGKPASD
jgi:hypothetical protein